MSFTDFAEMGGFKLLAIARLSSGSYSMVCYLLNCRAAGIEDVVSSPGELAVLLGISEKAIKSGLLELSESQIIQQNSVNGKSFVLRMVLDPGKWVNLRREPNKAKRSHLGDAKNLHRLHPKSSGLSFEDALVFPVKRPPDVSTTNLNANRKNDLKGNLKSLKGGMPNSRNDTGDNKTSEESTHHKNDTVQKNAEQIFSAFQQRHPGLKHSEKELSYAYLLAESHPTQQVLDLIFHFEAEISSLGLLAGAWLHYQEKFHKVSASTVQVDFAAFRKKHEAAERRLRSLSQAELKSASVHKIVLTPDEELLLRLFLRHDNPRKQLYWAIQARERYPHLQNFFSATSSLVLFPENPRRS